MKDRIIKVRNVIKGNKALVENFSYLSLLQVLNLVLPLLSYPYLIRVLGVSVYGTVIFAQAIVGYFVILIGFGFNISATKDVSVHREDKSKLSEIVSSVLIIKMVLFIISLILLVPVLFYFDQASQNKELYFLTLWICIYEIFFPAFYFQGIEKMKYISMISLVVRSLSVASIFIFINSKDQYLYVPIINLCGALLSGILAMHIIFFSHKLRFYVPKFEILKYYFKESIPVFLSNISVQIYVSTNKVLIGLFLGMTEVSYYDLGEKVLNILRIPQGILSQAVFPKISFDKNISFVKNIFKYSMALNLILFAGLAVFSEFIIRILGGEQMLPAKWVVIILGLTLPIVAVSNIFGMLVLIPFDFNKLFSKIIMSSGLVFMVQLLVLWGGNLITIYSLCLITVITEIFVSLEMYYYIKKNNLW
ncbi:flippase [Flavobacterium sp. XN-5]|uniref:flippase n=1 Tax=Flavobacterium sp. XN-5 TaxID=2599390 RepID=UPI0011C9B0ED|nr:flippase [Flavobacterium sp. XN-5]NGY37417.1 flippase [Flavobacterium sp. XN-5]